MTQNRIGYVVKRYPRFSETFIVNEILAHEAAGLEVEIFSLLPPCDTHFQDSIAWVRAPVHYLPGEGSKVAAFWNYLGEAAKVLPRFWESLSAGQGEEARDVYQAIALAKMARERNIRHLHAHFATSATSVARLAARFAGITYSFTAHAKDIFHESIRADGLRRKLNDAAAVVTVSDFNAAHLRQSFGEAANKVRRIYNGLDLKRLPYSSPECRPPTIVAVGRLVEKKGFEYLIEACALLRDKGRSLRCKILGGGELESSLRLLIRRLGLESTVALLGPCPLSEITKHLHDAAVLAAPCVVGQDGNRDGLPTVLLEAMALGTPCVSTDVTGIPEAVQDGITGLMVPQRDAAALAAAIERLLDDPPLRVQLAQRARALVEAEFDIHSNAARLRKTLFSAP